MNKNRNYIETKKMINEMKQSLNGLNTKKKRYTLEGLVYGEDGEEMMGNDMEQGGGQMGDFQQEQQPQMDGNQQQMGGNMPNEGDGEPNPLDGDPEITNLITKIRVMTLEGLRKLAENPESPQYELLKKIFLMVDKAVEDKVDPEK